MPQVILHTRCIYDYEEYKRVCVYTDKTSYSSLSRELLKISGFMTIDDFPDPRELVMSDRTRVLLLSLTKNNKALRVTNSIAPVEQYTI